MPTPAAAAPHPHLHRYTAAQERAGFGRYQYALLALVSVVHMADAVELMAISFVMPAAKSLQLDGPRKGWLSASVFMGMLLGGWIGGTAADRHGRRPVMVLALLVDAAFSAASSLATSYGAMLALRALGALGIGAVVPVVFTYWSEFLTHDRRERWLIFLAMSWFGGAIFSCGLAWALIPATSIDLGDLGGGERFTGWRVYLAACATVSALGALLLAAADESPRWHFCANRPDEAARLLARVARVNHRGGDVAGAAEEDEVRALICGRDSDGADAESASLLGSSRRRRLSEEEDAAEDEAEQEVGGPAQRHSAFALWASVFRGSFAVPTALLCVLWFAHSFSFYGIVAWLPQMLADYPDKVDVYANTFLAAVLQFPGSLMALLLVPVLGAHRVLSVSLAAAGVSVYLLMAAGSATMAVAMSGGYMALGTAAWNTTVIATTAEYPTVVRSTAWGILSAVGRLGAIAGTLVFGHLGGGSKAVPLTAVCVASLLAAAAVAWLERRSHFHAHGHDASHTTVKAH